MAALTLAALGPTNTRAQTAFSAGAGVGTLGTTAAGYVAQLSASIDAPLRGRTRWWAGLHTGRDADPGVASPGIRQAVTELVVSAGPLLPIQLPRAGTLLLGGGVYGVARRYGAGRVEQTGETLFSAGYTGGDWGAVARTALHLPLTQRLGVLLDGQWRFAYEGTSRRTQPAVAVGVRKVW